MCNTDGIEKPTAQRTPYSTTYMVLARPDVVCRWASLPLHCQFQSRPVDEFMEDFEQQEKAFKEEVAQSKERNAQRKASLHFTKTMHVECSPLGQH